MSRYLVKRCKAAIEVQTHHKLTERSRPAHILLEASSHRKHASAYSVERPWWQTIAFDCRRWCQDRSGVSAMSYEKWDLLLSGETASLHTKLQSLVTWLRHDLDQFGNVSQMLQIHHPALCRVPATESNAVDAERLESVIQD